MTHVLERRQTLRVPLADVFAFFSTPRNLARITPPWLRFRIVGFEGPAGPDGGDPAMREGLRIRYRVHPFGVPQRWVSEITAWQPPHGFVDEQIVGPYRSWRHEHGFRAVAGGTEIADRVEYALPFGVLGDVAHHLLVGRQLRAIFDFRARAVAELLERERGRG